MSSTLQLIKINVQPVLHPVVLHSVASELAARLPDRASALRVPFRRHLLHRSSCIVKFLTTLPPEPDSEALPPQSMASRLFLSATLFISLQPARLRATCCLPALTLRCLPLTTPLPRPRL